MIAIKYIEANDISGKYCWWTPEMEAVEQFEHANTLEEVKQKAVEQLIVLEDHSGD